MNDGVLAFDYSKPYADGDEVTYHGIRLKAHMMPTGQLAFLPVTVGNALVPDGMEVAVFKSPTVIIGDAVWMSENLAIDDGGEGIHYNPENKQYYYTWDAAMRIAKSIPGWHPPSAEEWNAAAEACGATVKGNEWKDDPYMRDYVGTEKLYDTLKVLPVGYYDEGSFNDVGLFVDFWSTAEYNSNCASCRSFDTNGTMFRFTSYKDNGFSVRLVKDSEVSA